MNIPNEAVEAAIEALRTRPATLGVQTWKNISLTVLEAAAPQLMAAAFEEGQKSGMLGPLSPNPYGTAQ